MEAKSKRIRIIVALVAVLVIAISIGIVVFSNSPEKSLKKQLDLGQKYLSELNYEQAVAAFKEALSIEPNNEQARESLVNAYLMWAEDKVANNDIEGAIAILTEAYELLADERIKDRLDELSAGSAGKELVNYLEICDKVAELYDDMRYDTPSYFYNGTALPMYLKEAERSDIYGGLASEFEAYVDYLESNEAALEKLRVLDSEHPGNLLVSYYELEGNKYPNKIIAYRYLLHLYHCAGDNQKAKELVSTDSYHEAIDPYEYGHTIDECGYFLNGTNDSISYEYDSNKKLVRQSFSDGQSWEFFYDEFGRIIEVDSLYTEEYKQNRFDEGYSYAAANGYSGNLYTDFVHKTEFSYQGNDVYETITMECYIDRVFQEYRTDETILEGSIDEYGKLHRISE